jgi:hypothetical protein
MQKIDIEQIIWKIQKLKYWDYYKKTLEDLVWEKNLKYCIWIEWILEINDIGADLKKLLATTKWNKFDNLKKEFLNLVFEEINYCPNCWKTPFLNTNNLNLKSFDLDHFFPKSKFPYLKFNFYNLIPICPFCNQKIKKGRNPLDYEWKIFNPYFWILEIKNKKVKFTNDFDLNKCLKFYNLNWFLSCKVNEWYTRFLNITEIYFSSKDTNNTFNFIQDKIYKIKEEQNRLPYKNIEKNWEEYFFKDYFSKDKVLKFSNWKLKKDLIENLKL